MNAISRVRKRPETLGLIGYGAFGQLVARHVAPHLRLRIFDSRFPELHLENCIAGEPAPLESVASCDVVVLAVPVAALDKLVPRIAPHVRADALVLDVGSVKLLPSQIMEAGLPKSVNLLGTHPLFGPQSAQAGLTGLKIALCPIRGDRTYQVGAFCRKVLGLRVVIATAEEHDREAAMVQGLTHHIAKVLVEMEPLPNNMTTRSFELLMQGIDMVRDDAPEVFDAIERLNPFAPEVRRRFFDLAAELDDDLSIKHR